MKGVHFLIRYDRHYLQQAARVEGRLVLATRVFGCPLFLRHLHLAHGGHHLGPALLQQQRIEHPLILQIVCKRQRHTLKLRLQTRTHCRLQLQRRPAQNGGVQLVEGWLQSLLGEARLLYVLLSLLASSLCCSYARIDQQLHLAMRFGDRRRGSGSRRTRSRRWRRVAEAAGRGGGLDGRRRRRRIEGKRRARPSPQSLRISPLLQQRVLLLPLLPLLILALFQPKCNAVEH